MTTIDVANLTAIYPSGKGIFNISFGVNSGEAFGFLGPNGAGKTTTIRIMMGFMNANQGNAKIMGKDCRKHAHTLQNSIGYLPGEIAFYEHLTGAAFLKLISDMRKTHHTALRDKLVEAFELDTTMLIKKMSKGTKQKLGIVTALMHSPDIYILDEPTSGLDPLMKSVFLDLLKTEKQKGKTIFMSSHDFDEVEQLCDTVGIIKEGHMVVTSDIEKIKSDAQTVFAVTFKSNKGFDVLTNAKFNFVKTGATSADITLTKDYTALFATLAKCNVTAFSPKPLTLETTFMQYYKKGGES